MTAEEIMRAELARVVCDIGPDYPALSGRGAIRTMVEAYFTSGATDVDLRMHHLAVDGHVVLMERLDHWVVNGKTMDTRVMGAYEVKNEKITAWREYFVPPSG